MLCSGFKSHIGADISFRVKSTRNEIGHFWNRSEVTQCLPSYRFGVRPFPGTLPKGVEGLSSVTLAVKNKLLARQPGINFFSVPSSKVLNALTSASCQQQFCYGRAELLGGTYLKFIISKRLFLKFPNENEGQLTCMRQQIVSNSILNQCALRKGLQRYARADLFALSGSFTPGMPPLLGWEMLSREKWDDVQERGENDLSLITNADTQKVLCIEEVDIDSVIKEDAKLHNEHGVISKKVLAKVVEGLVGVHLLKGDQEAATRLMKWLGISVDYSDVDVEQARAGCLVPRPVLDSIDFKELEAAIGYKFQNRNLLAEAITHASCTLDVPCYQRLEFVGDAVLDHLITRHLFLSYKDLPPGGLTDLRSAAVNNYNFARISVKHKLHLHLRHGSSALEARIHDFANDIQAEMHKPVANASKINNCNPPKVLGDVLESLAGAVFLDANLDADLVWEVFEPLLQPLVTPETLSVHPVRQLQELCQKEAEGLEYRASRVGDMAAVDVFVDGKQVGSAQHLRGKVAKKLAAWSALSVLKEKHLIEAAESQILVHTNNERKTMNEVRSNASRRQILNEICSRRRWPKPQYRCVSEGGPPHAKEFTYSVRVYTTEHGWINDCIGQQMPSVKKAQDSAAASLLDLLWQLHMHIII